ncbi:pyridine nucleotide-disulfide oxidoreductase [Methanoculleus taiwanensis]|uniref:Pyridine nucleotide-disulfide oxidoreductase n=1 Tax=Methanoculleus taiwanensis TaxID=1550565 RepID=A0A498H289_9EURY|nr:NAD(P)/FAD-dependent oxidoreductase [Methanoculleus taiwanensis]RXE57012.1 pyridine nucleotide-disulfide oxidoreductase [Methanoculleus taiwanensis]
MEWEYDLVVIGTGTAGTDIAVHCRKAGKSVAIADYREFGGTCALWGCIPKKVLGAAAEVVARAGDLHGKGIIGGIAIDWPALVGFERSFTDPVPARKEEMFEQRGIDAYHGCARFTGEQTIEVGGETLRAKQFVIATGSKPRPLQTPGADLMTTSDEFLYLERLPKRIVFIGGGYISFELAHVAARAGAEVTILQRSGEVLKRFDSDLVDRLVTASGEAGIDIRMNMPLYSIEKAPGGLIVRAGPEGRQIFEADMVVHGVGRVSAIDNLDLAKGNVETDKKGIVVNEYLQSVSNPAVYVAGDANYESIQLTPVATLDAHVVVDNILNGNRKRADYSTIPSAIFSIPSLAAVGLSEATAKKNGIEYDLHSGDMSSWYASRRIGLRHAAYKLLLEKKTGRILGAHVLGDNAGEIINLFALAIRHSMTAADLTYDAMIYAYPTSTYEITYMVKGKGG